MAALALAFGLALLSATHEANAAKGPLVTGVGTIGITVSDLDRSIAFYRDVLAFSVAGTDEATGPSVERVQGVFGAHVRRARLELGDEAIVLTQYVAPRGRPVPADMRSNDRAFQHIAIVVSDMERAYQHLRARHVRHISNEPQTLPAWNPNAGGIKAFYFADPDDHALEVIWFPPGKGAARWQRTSGTAAPLFLGIDHTAIAVADTARSLRLYRDTFGMEVAGESENHGTEQEHLNAVFGAHLRITALRARSGPGIELLEYLSPRDGRPAPPDLRANDLSHWQTVLSTKTVAAAATAAQAAGAAPVSPTPVDIQDRATRIRRASLIRDPDGHGLMLAE
jgi:catechol 2,3-dioxygenase-like lactoylglutathione lyase family enzyme